MMRECVLDVETTGLDPKNDRVVEIGCIELIDRILTDKTFHSYFFPQCRMPADAFAVHGLSTEFLRDKPLFSAKFAELMTFIGDAKIVAHNADFDLGFLNAEIARIGGVMINHERLVDTLLIARRRYPGSGNTLDDLCKRFGIDTARREKHGALIDAELLANVYVELIEDRQGSLDLMHISTAAETAVSIPIRKTLLVSRLTQDDIVTHHSFIATIKDAIWNDYWSKKGRIAA